MREDPSGRSRDSRAIPAGHLPQCLSTSKAARESKMPYLDSWHRFHHDFIHHVRRRHYCRHRVLWGLGFGDKGVDSAQGQLTYEENRKNNSVKSTRAAALRSRLFHVSNLLFSSSLQSSKALICVSNPLFPSDAGSTH